MQQATMFLHRDQGLVETALTNLFVFAVIKHRNVGLAATPSKKNICLQRICCYVMQGDIQNFTFFTKKFTRETFRN